MNIVLSILQVLGWILLIALLLVIVVLLIVLFCPVRYQVEGEWLEEKWARFKAHWLLHLFRVKISYGDDLIYGEVHIFWKKITFSYDLTKKEDEDNLEDSYEGTEDESEEIIEEPVIDSNEDSSSESFEEEESSDDTKIEDDDEKESIVLKIKGIIERIKEIYQKAKKILSDEKNQDAIKHIKDEVICLIKIFLPKKSKVDAVFSTGSPDTTGQLFGILALFPAMYQKNWKLVPDFQADDPYFKGKFWCKGRIRASQFVGIVLRILFDKNCRRLYTILNKFINSIKNDKSQEEK